MTAINLLFWITGAAVWSLLAVYLGLAIWGECTSARSWRRFKRQRMTPEEFAALYPEEEPDAAAPHPKPE
jgi:hypothetical protein